MSIPASPEVVSVPAVTAPSTGPSTWDTIKNGAVDAVYWAGRQVQWLGTTLKNFAVNVVNFVKPFFQSLVKFVAESADKVKELVVNNQKETMLIGVTAAITAIVSILGYYLLCGDPAVSDAQQLQQA